MTDQRLDRLLWRCEYGKLAPELLEIELRAALNGIADALSDLLPRAATIRLWSNDLLRARDDAFTRATRAVAMLRFREALQQIHRCESVTVTMRRLLEALDSADRAEEAMTAVHALARTARLRSLPAVASLGQIVDAARSSIVEQQYLRAAHVANVCGRMAKSLLRQKALQSHEHAVVEERLQDIEGLCSGTRPFAESPQDDPARDGTLGALRGLFDQHYVRLGGRLIGELEIQLAGRRRFLLHYQRREAGRRVAVSDLDHVRLLVRERSWDGAVDHLWHQSIAGYAGAIEQQRRRVGAAVTDFNAAIEPSATE